MTVTVMISGGFALAYQTALPDFQRRTGITVETLSGASQGNGPKTIRHQLAHGAEVDVVILSNEGLHELAEDGRVAEGTAVELATAPLAAAVRGPQVVHRAEAQPLAGEARAAQARGDQVLAAGVVRRDRRTRDQLAGEPEDVGHHGSGTAVWHLTSRTAS